MRKAFIRSQGRQALNNFRIFLLYQILTITMLIARQLQGRGASSERQERNKILSFVQTTQFTLMICHTCNTQK